MVCSECERLKNILGEIINSLIIYDVIHIEFPLNLLREYQKKNIIRGLAVDDMKRIYIDKNACNTEKRETVIHELFHTFHYRRGDYDNTSYAVEENEVARETQELFELIYPPPKTKKRIKKKWSQKQF